MELFLLYIDYISTEYHKFSSQLLRFTNEMPKLGKQGKYKITISSGETHRHFII